MTTLSPEAQQRLDHYLRDVHAVLKGYRSVSADDVEQDIREHVDQEFQAIDAPVSVGDLDRVLHQLGSPNQWVPQEELSAWRRFLIRLRSGPEDWRLAYLAFGLLLLGFLVWPLFLIFLIASFCVARGALAVTESRLEELGGQKWLMYPSLVLLYAGLLLIVLAWPIPASMLVMNDLWLQSWPRWGYVAEEAYGLRYPPVRFMVYTAGSALAVWWLILSVVLLAFPRLPQAVFHPFADRFNRKHVGVFFMIAVVPVLLVLAVFMPSSFPGPKPAQTPPPGKMAPTKAVR